MVVMGHRMPICPNNIPEVSGTIPENKRNEVVPGYSNIYIHAQKSESCAVHDNILENFGRNQESLIAFSCFQKRRSRNKIFQQGQIGHYGIKPNETFLRLHK
jgi:hypothetical protein